MNNPLSHIDPLVVTLFIIGAVIVAWLDRKHECEGELLVWGTMCLFPIITFIFVASQLVTMHFCTVEDHPVSEKDITVESGTVTAWNEYDEPVAKLRNSAGWLRHPAGQRPPLVLRHTYYRGWGMDIDEMELLVKHPPSPEQPAEKP